MFKGTVLCVCQTTVWCVYQTAIWWGYQTKLESSVLQNAVWGPTKLHLCYQHEVWGVLPNRRQVCLYQTAFWCAYQTAVCSWYQTTVWCTYQTAVWSWYQTTVWCAYQIYSLVCYQAVTNITLKASYVHFCLVVENPKNVIETSELRTSTANSQGKSPPFLLSFPV